MSTPQRGRIHRQQHGATSSDEAILDIVDAPCETHIEAAAYWLHRAETDWGSLPEQRRDYVAMAQLRLAFAREVARD